MRPGGQDPHRTLGISPGAGEAEIRRAYRALAKRYHPDAGEGSTERFIEIQAAYEALLGQAAPGAAPASRTGRRPAQSGSAGSGGGAGAGARSGGSAGSTWARRPKDAGSGRPGAASPGRPGATASGRPGAAATDEAGTWSRRSRSGGGGSRSSGPSSPGGAGDGRRDAGEGRRDNGKRTATLGSTSYDEAEEVFEPDWGGASWYGASSGTYWTINPKEYADPRKHGPEYQARARRRAAEGGEAEPAAEAGEPGAADASYRGTEAADRAAEAADRGPEAAGATSEPASPRSSRPRETPGGRATPPGATPPAGDAPGASSRSGRPTPGDLPSDWRAQAWTAAGPPGSAPPTFEHDPAPPVRPTGRAPGAAPAAQDPGPTGPPAVEAALPGSDASRGGGPGTVARVVLALAGWAVPGLALAAVAGLPGGLVATLPLQAAGVALLAFRPRVAWAAAGGGLALVFAAIPIVAVVAALGGPVVPGEPMPVAAVLAAVAWGGGLVAVASGRVAPFPWRPGG